LTKHVSYTWSIYGEKKRKEMWLLLDITMVQDETRRKGCVDKKVTRVTVTRRRKQELRKEKKRGSGREKIERKFRNKKDEAPHSLQ